MKPDAEKSRMPRGRMIALIIAATGAFYVGLQFLGASLGWSNRTLAFFDLAALAIFGWALVSAFLIWRARQKDTEG